jgi:membrane protein
MNTETVGRQWERLRAFLATDIWRMEPEAMRRGPAAVVRTVRILILTIRGLAQDELPIRASSLTFISLMSLVPMLAMVFSLLKGLGFGQTAIADLTAWQAGMPEEFQGFVQQVVDIVQNTNVAGLGWIGLTALVLMGAGLLNGMEAAFNRIWGIRANRDIMRRVANYVSLVVIVPILIGVAGTVMATLQSEAVIERLGTVAPLYRGLLKLTPLATSWLAFGCLYTMLPNTRVRLAPALISGLAGGVMWLAWQKIYITFQVGIARYNAIYGTFAVIPVFMAWLYISWMIILLGAEIAFAVQHHETIAFERGADSASFRARSLLALDILVHCARALTGKGERFDVETYSKRRGAPVRLIHETVEFLVHRGLLARTADRRGEVVLARSPDRLPVRELVEALADEGGNLDELGIRSLSESVRHALDRVGRGIDESLGDLSLADLAPAEDAAG